MKQGKISWWWELNAKLIEGVVKKQGMWEVRKEGKLRWAGLG